MESVQEQLRQKDGQLREVTQQLTNVQGQLQERDGELRQMTQQLINVQGQLQERDGELRQMTQQLTKCSWATGRVDATVDKCSKTATRKR